LAGLTGIVWRSLSFSSCSSCQSSLLLLVAGHLLAVWFWARSRPPNPLPRGEDGGEGTVGLTHRLGRNQFVQFFFEFHQYLVVTKSTQRFAASFQVDEVGAAPEAQVGVVSLAGAVDAAAHHGDRDFVVLGVLGQFLDLGGQ